MVVEELQHIGYPVPIIVQNDETQLFELDQEALESVLLDPKIADKPVCVVAVAGAFRKGKSFLLDFFLRYMYSENKENWLGSKETPLTGFNWKQGYKRQTTGVLLWSDVFLVKKPSGEEMAVLLMDTQGTFDTQSSMKDSTIVFALTTMVSSVLIYNLMNNIQEDDLMNLQLFTSYGTLAHEDGESGHPFQKLQFLVRDWAFPYEIENGSNGGQKLLDDILMVNEKQHPAHQQVRKDLRKCFKDINCYLMPHPGMKVVQKANFDGRLKDIEKEFVENLLSLVPSVLSVNNLVKKEIGGQVVKSKDLLKFFTLFMEVFKDENLPEPTTLVEFAAQASSQSALEGAKEAYEEVMETLVGGDKPYLKTVHLEAEHNKAKEKAVITYFDKNRYGRKNELVVSKYQDILIEEIDKMFEKYSQQNEAKNVFKAARTPAVLFSVLVFFYLVSGIFGLFGIYSFASLCNMSMGIALLLLCLWAYIRYSGEYRETGIFIDELASIVWDQVLQPLYQTHMERPLKEAAEQAAQNVAISAFTNGKMKSS